jgi:hypothetical protein
VNEKGTDLIETWTSTWRVSWRIVSFLERLEILRPWKFAARRSRL